MRVGPRKAVSQMPLIPRVWFLGIALVESRGLGTGCLYSVRQGQDSGNQLLGWGGWEMTRPSQDEVEGTAMIKEMVRSVEPPEI